MHIWEERDIPFLFIGSIVQVSSSNFLVYLFFHLFSELSHLSQLLEKSSDLTVKVATGQAIALLFEIARDTDQEVGVTVDHSSVAY